MVDKKIYKFIFAGILNTIFGYIIFSLIFYLLNQKELSLTLSFIISIFFNYFTIGSYVFNNNHTSKKLVSFIAVYLFIYLLNLLHLLITVDLLLLNVYFSQFITLFYLPTISYIINKNYVFKKKSID